MAWKTIKEEGEGGQKYCYKDWSSEKAKVENAFAKPKGNDKKN